MTNFRDRSSHFLNSKLLYILISFLIVFTTCRYISIDEGKAIIQTADTLYHHEQAVSIPNLWDGPSVIYRSIDLGKSWAPFDKGIPNNSTLSDIQQEGNKIYVTTDYHGIYFSENGKNKWQHLSSQRLNGLDINCIEVDNETIVIGSLKNGVLYSYNSGQNWVKADGQINKYPIRAFVKKGNILLAGTDSGIFESEDMGRSWSHTFGDIQILGFTILNDKVYAATQNGALVSSENLTGWKSIYEGDALHDIGNDGKHVYAMTIGQQLLKSKDDGETWINAQAGIIQPWNYYTNELKHIENHIFSAQWLGIYYSNDQGAHWEQLDGLPDSTAFSTLEITDYGIIAGISIR